MQWNAERSTYHSGKKVYKKGDDIPDDILEKMGVETVKEYVKKGLMIGGAESSDVERKHLIENAKSLGLSPHPKTGIAKLNTMIDDFHALKTLKKEALSLGIDPSDDVTFVELTELVKEKNELD